MRYFKEKMDILRREYTKKDRNKLIKEAGDQCSWCQRKKGDTFLFGPTHYLKKKLRFKVKIDIHVITGAPSGMPGYMVICNGCHISYHLFNRLSESASFGNVKLDSTVYKRCSSCRELSCLCCNKHKQHMKYCGCSSKLKKPAKTAETQ